MADDQPMMIEREPGPSWARPNWPVAELDDINLGLDPTEATIEAFKKAATEKAAAAAPAARFGRDPPRRGRFDPRDDADPHLSRARASRGQARSARPHRQRAAGRPDARISRLRRHRPRPADLDRRRRSGFEQATVREIVAVLQANYCGTVGFEYMHINDLEERRFIQDRIEGKDAEIQFTPEGKTLDPRQGHPSASSGKNSSRANMSARNDSGSTAAKARSRRSKR